MHDHHPYLRYNATLDRLVSRAESLAKLAAADFDTCAQAFDFADRSAAMFANCDQRLGEVETEIRDILDRVQQLANFENFADWPALRDT